MLFLYGLVHINREYFCYNKISVEVTVTSFANRPIILMHVFRSLGSVLSMSEIVYLIVLLLDHSLLLKELYYW